MDRALARLERIAPSRDLFFFADEDDDIRAEARATFFALILARLGVELAKFVVVAAVEKSDKLHRAPLQLLLLLRQFSVIPAPKITRAVLKTSG